MGADGEKGTDNLLCYQGKDVGKLLEKKSTLAIPIQVTLIRDCYLVFNK